MVTTELGACEWFVGDLRRSNLIERGQLDQLIGEFLGNNPGAEPPALAEHLVRQGTITQFQAERLLQGKIQGFVLGPYTIMDALGTGSMGTVYKAQSKTDNALYAVKVLPRRSMWNVRLARRKVREFEQCRHPAVVPFVDVGTSGSTHYLAWPLVQGQTLENILQQQGKLSHGQAAQFALQAAEGLEDCHQHGLFHGVIKPSNLMVTPENELRILDFGIGCLLAEQEDESLVDTMSTANSVASGLDCASPESIMDPSNLTPAGDQYSLGCVLYYCLTGRYPFPDGSAAEKMMAHQFKHPKPIATLNPEVPPELIAVIERLMQKAPEARYPSIAEASEALQPLADEGPAPAPAPAPEPIRPRAARDSRVDLRRGPAPVTKVMPRMAPHAPGALPPSHSPHAAPTLPTRAPVNVPATTVPVAPPVPVLAPTPAPVADRRPSRPVDEPVGSMELTMFAMLACALVWLLSRNLF